MIYTRVLLFEDVWGPLNVRRFNVVLSNILAISSIKRNSCTTILVNISDQGSWHLTSQIQVYTRRWIVFGHCKDIGIYWVIKIIIKLLGTTIKFRKYINFHTQKQRDDVAILGFTIA